MYDILNCRNGIASNYLVLIDPSGDIKVDFQLVMVIDLLLSNFRAMSNDKLWE